MSYKTCPRCFRRFCEQCARRVRLCRNCKLPRAPVTEQPTGDLFFFNDGSGAEGRKAAGWGFVVMDSNGRVWAMSFGPVHCEHDEILFRGANGCFCWPFSQQRAAVYEKWNPFLRSEGLLQLSCFAAKGCCTGIVELFFAAKGCF